MKLFLADFYPEGSGGDRVNERCNPEDSDDEDLGLLYESIRIEQNKRIRNELLTVKRNGSFKRNNSLKKSISKFRGQLDKELMDYRAQKNPFLSYGIGI